MIQKMSIVWIIIALLLVAASCSIPGGDTLDPETETESIPGTRADTYVPAYAFSWDEYVSVGKDQIVQGPCFLFAAVAQFEAMVRLYYNRPTIKIGNQLSPYDSINLSEQQVYSNWSEEIYPIVPKFVNERRTYIDSTLAFAQYIGLVHDTYCPYTKETIGTYVTCFKNYSESEKASLRSRIIAKIPAYTQVGFSNESDLKKLLIQYGPIAIDASVPFHPTGHGMLLVGWKTVNGKTQWEFASDSWPVNETTWISFYPYYKEVKLENYVNTAWVILPSAGGKTISYSGLSTGSYMDKDGDGYYVWGFGQPKPPGCPGYSERDGNDNDPELGPIYSDLTYKKLTAYQSFQASSWGTVIGRASMTVKASGTFYWDYFSYKVSGSGYYMRIIHDGKCVVYVDEMNFKTSGSFPVVKGKTCTIEVVGGGFINSGYTVNFYGSVTVHN